MSYSICNHLNDNKVVLLGDEVDLIKQSLEVYKANLRSEHDEVNELFIKARINRIDLVLSSLEKLER